MNPSRIVTLLGLLLVGSACTLAEPDAEPVAASAAAELVTAPTGFAATSFAKGLTQPTAMDFAPDGRLFVAEQGGKLRIIKNGQLLPAPFLALDVDATGERGLLGVAFDPAFLQNRFVYVYRTVKTPVVHNRISRFRASAANPDVVEPGSETVLLDLDPLSSATNHNGGAIHFGPDGKLYVGVGENAHGENAQRLTNLLGKMLRLEPDGSVPADNPFVATATGNGRLIWALGLRNPFTFAFDPAPGGAMFIDDVGQDTWEEINVGVAGANYGWPRVEGKGTNPKFKNPLLTYGHGQSATTGCSIAGGTFYRAATFPAAFAGAYFFADACSGWVRVKQAGATQSAAFVTGVSFPVDLKVGPDGALYVLARGDGSVARVQKGSAPPPPPPPPPPADVRFGRDIQPIFDARCVGCHGGSGGLTLTAAISHGNLVGVNSTCAPTMKRVTAGDPQKSLLFHKTSGVPTCGGPMPRGTPGLAILAPAEFARIETWIANGAKND